MKLVIAIVLVSLLLGCSTLRHVGQKDGAGQAEFSNDWLECQAVSKNIRGYINDDTVVTCMQGKGWRMSTTGHYGL